MKAKQDNLKNKMQEMMRMFTHDLRNPLLNIQALVHELDLNVRSGKAMNEDTAETLDMLKETANRMDDMILATNEIYHCMFDELEIEPVDMHDMFLRCFASLKLAEEAIALDCSAMPMVDADPLMVQRIVLELLSNAKKAIATNTSNTSRHIRISTIVEHEMIWFCVEDSGQGFDEYEMDRVFEPFFSGKHFTYGAGMGLTRAKALVEHHGGQMSVDSVAGHALVGFSLPKSKKPTQ